MYLILIHIISGYLQLIINGIIHRDLKPENILVNNGIYKIADFNSSTYKMNSHLDFGGTIMYQSPEML